MRKRDILPALEGILQPGDEAWLLKRIKRPFWLRRAVNLLAQVLMDSYEPVRVWSEERSNWGRPRVLVWHRTGASLVRLANGQVESRESLPDWASVKQESDGVVEIDGTRYRLKGRLKDKS